MTLHLPDHQVFTSYKQRKVDIKNVISCPPGAGHPFIIWALTSHGEFLAETNEYIISDSNFLSVEVPIYPHGPAPVEIGMRECKWAEDIARNDPDWQADRTLDMAICHGTPVMTHSVFDCNIGRILSIDLDHGTSWIPQALARLWINLNPCYERKKNLLWQLLNTVTVPLHPLEHAEYIDTMQRFRDAFGHDRLSNTIMSWRWFIHALKNRAADPCDIQAFRQYYTDIMCGALVHESQGMQSFYQKQWRDRWYDDYIAYFKSQGIQIARISYDHLFFDLQQDTGTVLDSIDRDLMIRNSQNNLDILQDCSQMVTDQVRGFMQRSIDSMRQRLSDASCAN